MNQFLPIIFTFILNIWLASAFPFQLELFTGKNCTGNSIMFNGEGRNDLECVKNLLGKTFPSRKVTGWWAMVSADSDKWGRTGMGGFDFQCGNFIPEWFSLEKVQPFGVNNSSTPAIAIAPISKLHDFFVTTKPAEAFLPFFGEGEELSHLMIVTSGSTNWTLFENNNFEGKSACLLAHDQHNLHYLSDTDLSVIGSVVKTGDCKEYPSKIVYPVKPNSNFDNTVFQRI